MRRETQASPSGQVAAPPGKTAPSRLSFFHASVPLAGRGLSGTGLLAGGLSSGGSTKAGSRFTLDLLPVFLPGKDGLHVGFLTSAMYHGRRGDGITAQVGLAHLELFDRGRLGLLFGGASRTGPKGQVSAGLLVPYAHVGSVSGDLWMAMAGGNRTINRHLRLTTNALVERHGAVSVTTLDLLQERAVVRLGVAVRVDRGHVSAAPAFNLGLRF